MDRTVPVWVFLLSLLMGALFTVAFGWSIKSALVGNNRGGIFGDIAVAVANFPTVTKDVLKELTDGKDTLIRVPRPAIDLSGFRPVRTRPGIHVDGLLVKSDSAAVARAAGWRILVGAFTVDGTTQDAALVLSPDLEVIKFWKLPEAAIGGKTPRDPHRRSVHGFDVMKDGSIIFTYEGGISLQRVDRCGSRIWAVPGEFHHSVTIDDTGEFLWTMRYGDNKAELIRVATADGRIVQSISMKDIIAANPALDILEIRTLDDNDTGGNRPDTPLKWLPELQEAFHLNDVDPLPAALAKRFDGFDAGDLLVSARSLNLVFVLDPETLKVKWWRIGAVRRQHDPDWGPNGGEITVFDNRMGRAYSRIAGISTTSYRTRVLFDGRTNGFYSRVRGKHQIARTGNLIVTSAQQGRAFEVDPAGKPVVEFVNQKPGSTTYNYVISQTLWLPPENINFSPVRSCAQ